MATKRKIKTGVCDVHRYSLSDDTKRKVEWNAISSMWMCKNCERDVVLQAMASTGRKQQEYFNKINKQHKN